MQAPPCCSGYAERLAERAGKRPTREVLGFVDNLAVGFDTALGDAEHDAWTAPRA